MRVVAVLAAICAAAVASRLEPVPTDKCGASVITDDADAIYVFGLSEDSVVWVKRQKATGGWSLWRPLADRKKMTSGPKAVRFPNGTLAVFAQSTDLKYYVSVMTNEDIFSDWRQIADRTFRSPPKPVISSGGEVMVFGIDKNTKTTWYSVSTPLSSGLMDFSDFADLGQDATSSPSVVVDGEGLVHVFVRGTTRCIYHNQEVYNHPGVKQFGEWEGLGGVMASNPSIPATLNGVHHIEVFGRAADKALWHRGQTAQQSGTSTEWAPWVSHGGVLASGPAVAINDDGLAEVFSRATDKAIYHRSQVVDEGGVVKYSNWKTLGGLFSGTPSVITKADGTMFLTARGVDKAVWYSYQQEINGTKVFSGWKTLGGHTRRFSC